jgi:hypothetical protein
VREYLALNLSSMFMYFQQVRTLSLQKFNTVNAKMCILDSWTSVPGPSGLQHISYIGGKGGLFPQGLKLPATGLNSMHLQHFPRLEILKATLSHQPSPLAQFVAR